MGIAELNLRIMKIAALGGFFVSACGYYFKIKIDERLRESIYYKKAVAHLMAHRPLLDFMGEPIKLRNADLSDRAKNYTIDTSEANFEIPISGILKSGIMHFKAVRTPDENQPPGKSDLNKENVQPLSWKVVRLEVSIDGRPGERIVVPIKPLIPASAPGPQVTNPSCNPTNVSGPEVQKPERSAVQIETTARLPS